MLWHVTNIDHTHLASLFRWSMNLALKSFSKIMYVYSSVDSEDLYEVMELHVHV